MSKTIEMSSYPYLKFGAQRKKMKKFEMLQTLIFSDQNVALNKLHTFYKGPRVEDHSY